MSHVDGWQVFVPSILTVMMSWLSFWINIESVPARINLGLLTVVTVTYQSTGVNASMPRVSLRYTVVQVFRHHDVGQTVIRFLSRLMIMAARCCAPNCSARTERSMPSESSKRRGNEFLPISRPTQYAAAMLPHKMRTIS